MSLKVLSAGAVCASSSEDAEELLKLTYSEDPLVRKRALKALCPCHSWRETSLESSPSEFWDRICDMAQDEERDVRMMVLHTLCDGSPHSRLEDVLAALQVLGRDADPKIRRKARKALNSYQRSGRWNIF